MIGKKHYFVEDETYRVDTKGCWVWLGATDRNGYGTRRIGTREANKNWFAHRLSYASFNDDFDEDLCVLHTCDNPSCVNLDHLMLGSVRDNNEDRDSKNRNIRRPKTVDVLAIKDACRYKTQRAVAKDFNISESYVSMILKELRQTEEIL